MRLGLQGLRRRPKTPTELKSYQEYYQERWGRRGLCLEQPLLLAGRAPRPVLLAERSGVKRTKRNEEQERAVVAQQEGGAGVMGRGWGVSQCAHWQGHEREGVRKLAGICWANLCAGE